MQLANFFPLWLLFLGLCTYYIDTKGYFKAIFQFAFADPRKYLEGVLFLGMLSVLFSPFIAFWMMARKLFCKLKVVQVNETPMPHSGVGIFFILVA